MRFNIRMLGVFIICLSVVGFYSLNSYSHGVDDSPEHNEYNVEDSSNTVEDSGNTNELSGDKLGKESLKPRVTIIGNPAKLSQDIKDKLPTGYGWQTKDAQRPLNFDSGNKSDPIAMFLIDPFNPKLDMEKQMDFAIQQGKKEVYFIIDENNPSLKYEYTTPDHVSPKKSDNSLEQGDFDPFSINDIFFDFLTPAAYANPVQGTFCGGPRYPAGICSARSFIDDDPNDGQIPGFTFCAEFDIAQCFFDSVFEHSRKNYATALATPSEPAISCNHTSSNSSPCPFKDCMNAENSNNNLTFKAPVNLVVRLFDDVQQLREYGIATQGQEGAGGCGPNPPSNLCGCAGRPDLANPRRSINGSINYAGRNGCSWMQLIKHELAHTYGYTHNDFSNDLDRSKHCKNQHNNH